MNRSIIKLLVNTRVCNFRMLNTTSCQFCKNKKGDKTDKDFEDYVHPIMAELKEVVDPHNLGLTEDEIEKLRNKSNLSPYHYALMHGEMPFVSEDEMYIMQPHELRALYGKYGPKSGVPERKLWPSEQELEQMYQYREINNSIPGIELVRTSQEHNKDRKHRKDKLDMEIAGRIKGLTASRKKWATMINQGKGAPAVNRQPVVKEKGESKKKKKRKW